MSRFAKSREKEMRRKGFQSVFCARWVTSSAACSLPPPILFHRFLPCRHAAASVTQLKQLLAHLDASPAPLSAQAADVSSFPSLSRHWHRSSLDQLAATDAPQLNCSCTQPRMLLPHPFDSLALSLSAGVACARRSCRGGPPWPPCVATPWPESS